MTETQSKRMVQKAYPDRHPRPHARACTCAYALGEAPRRRRVAMKMRKEREREGEASRDRELKGRQSGGASKNRKDEGIRGQQRVKEEKLREEEEGGAMIVHLCAYFFFVLADSFPPWKSSWSTSRGTLQSSRKRCWPSSRRCRGREKGTPRVGHRRR